MTTEEGHSGRHYVLELEEKRQLVGEKVLVFCLLDVRGGNYRQAKRTASSIFGSDEFRGLEAKWMLRPRVFDAFRYLHTACVTAV
jgi:hypothetical protein